MAQEQKQTVYTDGRMHSTVFDKRDPKLNDLIRRFKKSDILKLYDVDCTMLMRVRGAYMQFDMTQNHRPYIVMYGNAEGVYLEPKTDLLFPNGCDQLDFRPDFQVETQIEYELSDVEIATLAANGLYRSDYSLQGKIIGSMLEIPCTIDYCAIKNTPITFIGIHDQLSILTNTRRTGYKTLVATFTPYELQKHDAEPHAEIIHIEKLDDKRSTIRERDKYEMQTITFEEPIRPKTARTGRDFVQTAQDRMAERLREGMKKGDILDGGKAQKTTKEVTEAVALIRDQSEAAKRHAMAAADGDASQIDGKALSQDMADMAQRVAYSGAEAIPVDAGHIPAVNLAGEKPAGVNDGIMTEPLTDVKSEPKPEAFDKDTIDANMNKLHGEAFEAEKTAADIVEKLSRKERLAARRQNQAAVRARQLAAAQGQEIPVQQLTPEEAASMPNTAKVQDKNKKDQEKAMLDLEGDVFASGFSDKDINEIIQNLGN